MKPIPGKKPLCVLCMALTEPKRFSRMQVLFTRDTQGTPYAVVRIPLCDEHQGVPTIHEHGNGRKP